MKTGSLTDFWEWWLVPSRLQTSLPAAHLPVLPAHPFSMTETHVLMGEKLLLTDGVLGRCALGPCVPVQHLMWGCHVPGPVAVTYPHDKIPQSPNRIKGAFDDQSCLYSMKPLSPPSWALR